jgi:hypothetical protein
MYEVLPNPVSRHQRLPPPQLAAILLRGAVRVARPRTSDADRFRLKPGTGLLGQRISLARRSSAFSRLSRRISAASSLVMPGRCLPSTSAWRTHFCSDSAEVIPRFAATGRIAAYSLSYSARCSATSRTARPRSSLGYRFGMETILPTKEVPTKPGRIHESAHQLGSHWYFLPLPFLHRGCSCSETAAFRRGPPFHVSQAPRTHASSQFTVKLVYQPPFR